VRLKSHGVQKYPDSIRVRRLAFKNTAKVLEATIIDFNLIAGLELFKLFHETITSNLRSNQVNDFIVDRNRLVAKTYEAVNASGKTNFVVQLVEPEASEDVPREKGLNQLSQLTRELIVLFHLQLRRKSFYSPGDQVIASANFLLRMGMDHVPAERVIV
jgi:hypothetical protein